MAIIFLTYSGRIVAIIDGSLRFAKSNKLVLYPLSHNQREGERPNVQPHSLQSKPGWDLTQIVRLHVISLFIPHLSPRQVAMFNQGRHIQGRGIQSQNQDQDQGQNQGQNQGQDQGQNQS